MDIKQFKKLSNSKIEAGRKTRAVRNELKQYKEAKQDAYEGVSESLQPLLDVEKSVKESIDKKQDELIEQLQKNQKAITSGLDDLILYQQLPETSAQDTKLPIDYKPAMMPESPPIYKSDLDKGFNTDEIITLTKYKLYPPSDVLKGVQNEELDFDVYNRNVGKLIKKLGRQKGVIIKK